MTKIDPTQPSQPADKPSKPAKAQSQQPIIIDFSVLPDKLKTQEVREKFDKDGSGFLESNGKEGNEYSAMSEFAKTMNIDLSKYKLDGAVNVETYYYSDSLGAHGKTSYAKDKDGKIMVNLKEEIIDGERKTEITTFKKNVETTKLCSGRDLTPEKIESIEHNVTFHGQKNLTKTTTTFENGDKYVLYENPLDYRYHYNENELHFENETILRKTEEYRPLKTTFPAQDAFYIKNLLESTLFNNEKSNNKLVKITSSEYKRPNIGENREATDKEYEENTTDTISYMLNGNPVDVVETENGILKVTNKKNETKYFSKEGKELSEEYATGNVTEYTDGRKSVVSQDGNTKWYYDNKGKLITEKQFNSPVHKKIYAEKKTPEQPLLLQKPQKPKNYLNFNDTYGDKK